MMGVTAPSQEVRITQKHFTPAVIKATHLTSRSSPLIFPIPPHHLGGRGGHSTSPAVCPHPCPSFKAQGHLQESSRNVPSAL